MSRSPNRIFLLGLRGTGKSTVAPLLAGLLGWDWCDMDAELERRYGQTVRDMFATLGEAGFRQCESQLLREICNREKVVVATGGGVILSEDNRALLRRAGWCVWLRASIPVMVARLQQDSRSATQRPTLTGLPLAEEMAVLLAQRQPLYEVCADLTLDTDHLEPAAVAARIFEHWRGSARLVPPSETPSG